MPDGWQQEPGGWNRFAIEVDDLVMRIIKPRRNSVERSGIARTTCASRVWNELTTSSNRPITAARKTQVFVAPATPPVQELPPNMAAEKTNTTTKPNKSQFIREQPSTMSAADVIAKGKAEGLTISTDHVYGVRSQARLKRKATKVAAKKTAAAKKGATPEPTAAAKKTSRKAVARNVRQPLVNATTSSAEELFRAVAAEIGLGRAIEILAAERARVRAMIGG